MTTDPVHVLFVAGSGRSGTTMVNNLLGQVDAVFAAGELRYLWHRGVVANHVCGCGQPFAACAVWESVMRELERAVGPVDAQALGDRLLRRLRVLRVPGMLWRRLSGQRPVPSHADDAAIRALYRAIQEETRAQLIVDSSKLPPYGLLLCRLPDVQVTVLHLIRDPRATAFSWRRRMASRDRDDDSVMPRQPVWKSSALWLTWNCLAAMLWPSRAAHHLRIRYEDLVVAPEATLAALCAALGVPATGIPFVDDRTVDLRPVHAVAGNPVRRSCGRVEIRPDDEWRHSMRPRDRRLVTVFTAPALAAFGYRLRATAGPTGSASPGPERKEAPRC